MHQVMFFLHDKVDVMNIDDILSFGISIYKDDDLTTAKQTLFRNMKCEADFVGRRDGDACKNNFADMLLKLTTAPPLQIKFWATSSKR